jgi:hypothetical protein
MAVTMDIEIKELFGDDLAQLEPILHEQGMTINYPHLAMAKVAYDGEKIVGYAVFQMVAHTEPLWVAPEYRGGELTHKLADSVAEFARQAAGKFVCVASSPFVEELCREQHMEIVPGTMFIGRA